MLEIEPLHPDFGAHLHGIDLAGHLSTDQVAEIRAAIDTYSLLVFPGQDLDDDALLAFTRRLGEPEPEHVRLGRTGEVTYFGTVGNVRDDGTVDGQAHKNTHYQTGNQLWHSDSSFREVPSLVSITMAHEVPDEGGATEFVSTRAAFERLPAAEQRKLELLSALHDYVFSRSQVAPVDPNHAASLPPVLHPLVRANPANGRKNLYIGSHTRCVFGPQAREAVVGGAATKGVHVGIDSQSDSMNLRPLPGTESRRLLDDLMKKATRSQDIYSHQWKKGDIVIWDNRCLLHRGTPYNADRYRRRMRQTRVVGMERGRLAG
ncbi:MAG: TauD/TfdA family dioxygenase [Pseudomonadota bacterium]